MISLLVATCCIVALGVSATTLQSSLKTEPDEVIEIDYDRLPIGQEDAERIKQEIESAEEDADGGETDEGAATSSAPEAGGGGIAFALPERSILGLLFDLLVLAFRFLLVMGAIALGYRYRNRLLAPLAGVVGAGHGNPSTDEQDAWTAVDPANAVDVAWLNMVANLDTLPPESQPCDEIARAAIESGMDPDVVWGVTELFEEVHYGGKPVTFERERRALRYIDQVDSGFRIERDSIPTVADEEASLAPEGVVR